MNAREVHSSESPHGDTVKASGSTGLRNGAERLRDITERIEGFLVEQIGRLEQAMRERDEDPRPAGDVQQMVQELEGARRRWETEKLREMERIQVDGVRLAEAWQRVEMAQRKLLAEQSALNVAAATNREAPLALGDSAPNKDSGQTPSQQPNGQAPARVAEEPLLTPESAILQFQQLRREMQQHTRKDR